MARRVTLLLRSTAFAVMRSTAFAVWFYGLTMVLGIAALPLRLFARGRILGYAQAGPGPGPAPPPRLCGVRLVLIGAENLPAGGAALIASEHQSAFDTLVWMTLLPRPAYVLKRELTRIPLFGPLLLGAGMIAVRREAGAAALRRLLADTAAAARDGRQIVIFPQGTRVAYGSAAPMQPGIVGVAASSGLPVIAVATDSGLSWARHAFCKRAGDIHIVIRRPIPPGLPRRDLLARIEAEWQAGRDQLARTTPRNPVDKSGE